MPIKGIILFGDSIFLGTGTSQRRNGCGQILRVLLGGIPILIKGHNKDSSREGLRRLKFDVLERNEYSHVILLFGNNDCKLIGTNKALIDFEEYRNNLRSMISQIISVGKKPLISNLQPIDSEGFYKTFTDMKQFIAMEVTPYQWHKRYSDICEEIARAEKIPLINIRAILEKRSDELLSSDGLHPNDVGHKLIAQIILEALKNLMI